MRAPVVRLGTAAPLLAPAPVPAILFFYCTGGCAASGAQINRVRATRS